VGPVEEAVEEAVEEGEGDSGGVEVQPKPSQPRFGRKRSQLKLPRR
jgi:hypothetical protein